MGLKILLPPLLRQETFFEDTALFGKQVFSVRHYLLDNQQQKASAASASLRETHYFEHSPWLALCAKLFWLDHQTIKLFGLFC
jgi:hypothetical protein